MAITSYEILTAARPDTLKALLAAAIAADKQPIGALLITPEGWMGQAVVGGAPAVSVTGYDMLTADTASELATLVTASGKQPVGGPVIDTLGRIGQVVVNEDLGPQTMFGGGGQSYLATEVEAVTTTTYTVLQADHNKIKDFTHVSGCTVTVPDGLTSGIAGVPFTCGLSKGDGGGDVTVVAGVGGAVEAPGGRLVMGDEFGLMTLTEWPDGSFRLYAGTA